MSRRKSLPKKIRLGRIGKIKDAPRWSDIRKFGLKRARSRRILVRSRRSWRQGRLKV